jgi:hypothetical protein
VRSNLKQMTKWATGQYLATDPAAGLDAENFGASIAFSHHAAGKRSAWNLDTGNRLRPML